MCVSKYVHLSEGGGRPRPEESDSSGPGHYSFWLSQEPAIPDMRGWAVADPRVGPTLCRWGWHWSWIEALQYRRWLILVSSTISCSPVCSLSGVGAGVFVCLCVCLFVLVAMDLRVSCMLGRRCTTEPHLQTWEVTLRSGVLNLWLGVYSDGFAS